MEAAHFSENIIITRLFDTAAKPNNAGIRKKLLIRIALLKALFNASLSSCNFDKAGNKTSEIVPFILL